MNARWGQAADIPACLALTTLSQDHHARLGVAARSARHFWLRRLREAARSGHVLLGHGSQQRTAAWRLIVSEDRVLNPFDDEAQPERAIVGMLVAHAAGPADAAGRPGELTCHIDNAYVRPMFRRRGHTSRMVTLLGEWATGAGAPSLDLQVARVNAGAVHAWFWLGFRLTDARADDGFVAMSMPLHSEK